MVKVVIVCFGFSDKVTRSQPWHMADGLANSLTKQGFSVNLITDVRDTPVREYPIEKINKLFDRGTPSEELKLCLKSISPIVTFVFIGSHELIKPNKFKLKGRVELVICNARFKLSELRRISFGGYLNEYHLLAKVFIGSLIPGFVLRNGYRKSEAKNIIYVSREAQKRYSTLGLPKGNLLLPAIDECYQPTARKQIIRKDITICYFGPPLLLRGGLIAVQAFEELATKDSSVRLKLLLRIKDEPYMAKKLAEIECSVSKSPFKDRIVLIKKYLTPEKLKSELESSSIFLLPFLLTVSDSPLVVIEAGLTGKPVVCINTPGVTEYVEELNGICVDKPELLGIGLIKAMELLNANSGLNIDKWPDWDERTEDITMNLRAL